MRKPKVENKYNIVPSDIKKFVLVNKDALQKKPFWRNNVVKAYCLSATTIRNAADDEYGIYNEYWIGFYDNGKIDYHVSAYSGMYNYRFDKFFEEGSYKNEIDLIIQEKLLECLNWLLDEEIVKLRTRNTG